MGMVVTRSNNPFGRKGVVPIRYLTNFLVARRMDS